MNLLEFLKQFLNPTNISCNQVDKSSSKLNRYQKSLCQLFDVVAGVKGCGKEFHSLYKNACEMFLCPVNRDMVHVLNEWLAIEHPELPYRKSVEFPCSLDKASASSFLEKMCGQKWRVLAQFCYIDFHKFQIEPSVEFAKHLGSFLNVNLLKYARAGDSDISLKDLIDPFTFLVEFSSFGTRHRSFDLLQFSITNDRGQHLESLGFCKSSMQLRGFTIRDNIRTSCIILDLTLEYHFCRFSFMGVVVPFFKQRSF